MTRSYIDSKQNRGMFQDIRDGGLKEAKRKALKAYIGLSTNKPQEIKIAKDQLIELSLNLEEVDDILKLLSQGSHLDAKAKIDKLNS